MKNELDIKVYYSDTDSFSVVWHGSYLRWLEMGRVELSRALGLNLVELEKQNIILPVVDIKLRYKSSAKLDDNLIVQTGISEVTKTSVTFEQIIRNKTTNTINLIAQVVVVAITKEGKLYKNLPNELAQKFKNVKIEV